MAAHPRYDWTILIYSMANEKELRSATNAFLQRFAAVDLPANIKVVMQVTLSNRSAHPLRLYDFETRSGASRHRDTKTGLEYTALRDVDPVHNLSRFIHSCRKRYSSKRCGVILQGHAWGIDYDIPSINVADFVSRQRDNSLSLSSRRVNKPYRNILGFPQGHSTLNDKELQIAVSKGLSGHKLAFFGMDACLMGMAEIIYQLRHCADYIVTMEGLSPTLGWPFEHILPGLARRGASSNGRVLGKLTLNRYAQRYKDFGGQAKLTMGLYDLHYAETLSTSVRYLASALTAGLAHGKLLRAIVRGRLATLRFLYPSYVDLHDLCDRISYELSHMGPKFRSAEVVAILSSCDKVRAAIYRRFVVSSTMHRGHPAHGLSIYFPAWQIGNRGTKGHVAPGYRGDEQTPSSLRVAEHRIAAAYLAHDFAARTAWDKFLVAFIRARKVHHPKAGVSTP